MRLIATCLACRWSHEGPDSLARAVEHGDAKGHDVAIDAFVPPIFVGQPIPAKIEDFLRMDS